MLNRGQKFKKINIVKMMKRIVNVYSMQHLYTFTNIFDMLTKRQFLHYAMTGRLYIISHRGIHRKIKTLNIYKYIYI